MYTTLTAETLRRGEGMKDLSVSAVNKKLQT